MTRILIAVTLLCAWMGLSGAARAGNVSELNILGFNAEGSIFAFEEYGIQDGSGFPYANRFYIDVASDSFVPGSPIRVTLEDEGATLLDAREQARAPGQAIVSDAELQANRGHTAGANAITEMSADPLVLTVLPRPVYPPVDEPIEFRLEEYPLSATGCEGITDTMGFRLMMIELAEGAQVELLNEDDSLPQSRNCPTGYRLGAVQTFFPDSGQPSFAVLIAIRSFGFEGPDYHWIAVTGRL